MAKATVYTVTIDGQGRLYLSWTGSKVRPREVWPMPQEANPLARRLERIRDTSEARAAIARKAVKEARRASAAAAAGVQDAEPAEEPEIEPEIPTIKQGPDFMPGDSLAILSPLVPGRVNKDGIGVFDDGTVMSPEEMTAAWFAHNFGWRPKRRRSR